MFFRKSKPPASPQPEKSEAEPPAPSQPPAADAQAKKGEQLQQPGQSAPSGSGEQPKAEGPDSKPDKAGPDKAGPDKAGDDRFGPMAAIISAAIRAKLAKAKGPATETAKSALDFTLGTKARIALFIAARALNVDTNGKSTFEVIDEVSGKLEQHGTAAATAAARQLRSSVAEARKQMEEFKSREDVQEVLSRKADVDLDFKLPRNLGDVADTGKKLASLFASKARDAKELAELAFKGKKGEADSPDASEDTDNSAPPAADKNVGGSAPPAASAGEGGKPLSPRPPSAGGKPGASKP